MVDEGLSNTFYNDRRRWSKKMGMACVALGTLAYLDVL
jgi:hypothetical protein